MIASGSLETQLLERCGDLLDRLHARRFHLSARNSRDGVVMKPRQLRHGEPSAVALAGVQGLQNVIEFHPTDYAYTPCNSQAYRPRAYLHDEGMTAKSKKKKPLNPDGQVARNLRALIEAEGLKELPWAVKYGLVQTTVNRIAKGADASISKLEEIAAAMRSKGRRIEAWQLLAPNLGEGLFEVQVTEEGETRVVPYRAPAEKQKPMHQVTQLPWTKKNHPHRREDDLDRKPG